MAKTSLPLERLAAQKTNAFMASGAVAQGWSASLEAWAETKAAQKTMHLNRG
jgi:hypothetical protein